MWLHISTGTGPSMSALDAIEYVTGSVALSPSIPLDASVLPALTTVGGDLWLSDYAARVQPDALPALVSIDGNLGLSGAVSGFPRLQTIGGTMSMYSLRHGAMSGFASLQSAGNIGLCCSRVDELSGLDGIRTLGSLGIWGTTIGSFQAFQGLESLGSLNLWANSIGSFQGSQKLQSIDRVDTWVNTIGSFEGFDMVQSLSYVSIRNNEFDVFGAFNGLQTLGSLSIWDNSIGSLEGFQALQSLGNLYIWSSTVRMDHAFPALSAITGSFRSNYSSMDIVSSFPVLARIQGELRGGSMAQTMALKSNTDRQRRDAINTGLQGFAGQAMSLLPQLLNIQAGAAGNIYQGDVQKRIADDQSGGFLDFLGTLGGSALGMYTGGFNPFGSGMAQGAQGVNNGKII